MRSVFVRNNWEKRWEDNSVKDLDVIGPVINLGYHGEFMVP